MSSTAPRAPSGPPRNPVVVIPARMASTRFPGKPLADILGEPMIVHVWRRACAADIGPVIVAAAEDEIADAVRQAGGRAVLTPPELRSGSDRIHAALLSFDPDGHYDAVVNVQGDLPTIEVEVVRAALEPLAHPDVDIATLVAEIADPKERTDPNVVKAAVSFAPGAHAPTSNDPAAILAPDLSSGRPSCEGMPTGMTPPGAKIGRVLYFSRAPVPSGEGPLYHHIGLYVYRRAALARFVALPESALERRERLEQLRALEAGMRIDARLVDTVPLGVDTPADLERARAILGSRGRIPARNR